MDDLPMVVTFAGTIAVTSLTRCPATIRISVDATGRCDTPASYSMDVIVRDEAVPTVWTKAQGGATGMNGTFVLPFSASLGDNVRIDASAVAIAVTCPSQNATVRQPVYSGQQTGPNRVDVVGTVAISNVTGGPATIRVEVSGTDPCGNRGTAARDVQVDGLSPPEGPSTGPGSETAPVSATAFL